jgi:hypothetical protein
MRSIDDRFDSQERQDFSFHYYIQTGCGTYPALRAVDIKGEAARV